MKINNKKILQRLGFNRKEISSLDNTDIEELIVILESLHIKDIKKYLLNNKILFTKNIFSLAKNMSLVFNKYRDYNTTEKVLRKNNYAIINEEGDNCDIF
ncbi:MAG TPA: hypothetical protein IAB38_03245 [Candidatus Onthousia excrementipullorum]|uniref:Uncharacterized protein n=1 Tax=Candidatus Onthousia excrementipullorum TaxID=2840884 RepID=A0A9D1DUG1_9FIRM|nr:hypothetical protein [Candidatus Onthousia excrementipullorum]